MTDTVLLFFFLNIFVFPDLVTNNTEWIKTRPEYYLRFKFSVQDGA